MKTSSNRIARKLARITLVLLATSFLILLFLIATPLGNKGLIAIANKSLSALSIEHESGSLASRLSIKALTWQADGTKISIADLAIDVNWECLASKRFCLEEITSSSLSAHIAPTTTQPTEPAAQASLLTLPMGVSVNNANFTAIDITIEDTASLTIEQLKASLSMHKQINVRHFSWESINVALPTAENSQPSQSAPFNPSDIANWRYNVPDIKPLFFPVIGELNDIRLAAIQINQNNQSLAVIEHIAAKITITEKQLNIQQLDIKHELGKLALTASVDTQLEHQLAIDILSEIDQKPLTANFTSSGSPKDVNLTMDTQGLVSTNLKAKVDILDSQLPLNAQLNWQDVKWPINANTDSQYQSGQGNVSIRGDMQNYQLDFNTDVSGATIPSTELSVTLSGNQNSASLEELLVETLDGQLTASGQLTIDNAIEWIGSLAFANIQPQTFFTQLDAELSGQSTYQARFDGKNYSAHLNNLDMTGLWQGYELNVRGEGTFDSRSGLNLPKLTLAVGDNSLDVQASLSQTQALDASLSLNAQNLEQLLPTLSGQINAESRLLGSLSEPQAQFSMNARSLTLDTLTVKGITATGSTQWSNNLTTEKPISLQVFVEALSADNQTIDTVNFNLTGTTKDHSSTLSVANEKVTFNTEFTGSLDDNFSQWNGQWLKGEVISDIATFSLSQTMPDILVNWQDTQYALGAHCWSEETTKLCIKDARFDKGQGNFAVEIQQLPLFNILHQVNPELAGIQSDTLLNVNAKGSLRENLPTLDMQAELTPAIWSVGNKGVSFNVEQLTTKTVLDKQQAKTTVSLISKQLGQLSAQMTVDDIQETRQAEGTIAMTGLDLSYFQALIPQLTQLDGQVNSDIALSGELSKPIFKGEFNLKGGAIAGPVLPSRISQINQVIKLDGESATLSGSYLFGDGLGGVEGNINWQDEPFGNIVIRGENMEIDHQNLIRAKISPDITLAYSEGNLSVSGELSVPYARIKVRDLPPSALSPSDDTIIVNQPQEEASPIKDLALNIQINVDQAKTDNVKVDAFGLTSDLQGHLLVTQNGGTILGDGQLNLVNGRYRAYGQDLTIRRGEVQFNGPVDSPFLDIEAIRNPDKTANEVIAGLRVEGLSQQPQISVFSVPELEQPEALSYLLRGRSISSSDDGGSSDTALTNLLIGFGLSKSENKVTKLGSKLGIDDFALATSGQGNDTKVAVSGSIAKGVQLRYGVGVFDSASEVALRYQLWPKLYLEAVSGLNNALDIYYQFNLEGKKATAQNK